MIEGNTENEDEKEKKELSYEHPLLKNLKQFAIEIRLDEYKENGKIFQDVAPLYIQTMEYDEDADYGNQRDPKTMKLPDRAIKDAANSLKKNRSKYNCRTNS